MSTLLALATLQVYATDPRPATLSLMRVNPTASPLAKCLDGSEPALYYRAGAGADSTKIILYMEGGGWCFPSEVESTGLDNCAARYFSNLGSSAKYPSTIPDMGYSGRQ
jgi:hypothetical protein